MKAQTTAGSFLYAKKLLASRIAALSPPSLIPEQAYPGDHGLLDVSLQKAFCSKVHRGSPALWGSHLPAHPE